MHLRPDNVSDDQAILLTAMWPTGWFAARPADVSPGSIGADALIDCVGQDAERPAAGPAALSSEMQAAFDPETREIAPDSPAQGFGSHHQWKPGDAPSVIDAYRTFDLRREGWSKVEITGTAA